MCPHSSMKYSSLPSFCLCTFFQAKKEERRKRAKEMLKQANIRNVSFDSSSHATRVSKVHFNCRINNNSTDCRSIVLIDWKILSISVRLVSHTHVIRLAIGTSILDVDVDTFVLFTVHVDVQILYIFTRSEHSQRSSFLLL